MRSPRKRPLPTLPGSPAPTFKVEGGLRYYRYDTSAFNNEWGYFFTPQAQPLSNPPGNFASASGVIPRADVAWMPNQNLTTYVSASKGIRPGGANMTIPLTACPEGGPASFDPDTVWDYEAGEKALFADNRIRVNADVYYIKWDKVQQTALLSCGTQYTTNAGDGRATAQSSRSRRRLPSTGRFPWRGHGPRPISPV